METFPNGDRDAMYDDRGKYEEVVDGDEDGPEVFGPIGRGKGGEGYLGVEYRSDPWGVSYTLSLGTERMQLESRT